MNVSHTLPLFLALHRPKHANTLVILRNLSEFICLPHTIISFELKKHVFLHFLYKKTFLKKHVSPNSGIFPSIHFFASIFRKIVPSHWGGNFVGGGRTIKPVFLGKQNSTKNNIIVYFFDTTITQIWCATNHWRVFYTNQFQTHYFILPHL